MFLNTETDFTNAIPAEFATLVQPTHSKTAGFAAGTMVETATGWRAVEKLVSGEAVYTLDGGVRTLQEVTRRAIGVTRAVQVPGGVIDNCSDMVLLPGQKILIEDPVVESAFGLPFVLVPAEVLVGYRGISWTVLNGREGNVRETVELRFAEQEVIFANSGVRVTCAGTQQAGVGGDFFRELSVEHGRALVALMASGTRVSQAA